MPPGPKHATSSDPTGLFILNTIAHCRREEIKRAYLAPNPTAVSHTGVLVFLREIPTVRAIPSRTSGASSRMGLHAVSGPNRSISPGVKDAAEVSSRSATK